MQRIYIQTFAIFNLMQIKNLPINSLQSGVLILKLKFMGCWMQKLVVWSNLILMQVTQQTPYLYSIFKLMQIEHFPASFASFIFGNELLSITNIQFVMYSICIVMILRRNRILLPIQTVEVYDPFFTTKILIKITVTFWFLKLRKSSRYFIWYEFTINLIRFFLWLLFYWRAITRYLLKSRGVVRVDPVAFRHVWSSYERNLMTTTFWR